MSFKFEDKLLLSTVIFTELVSCIMQVSFASSHIARCFKARHECFFVRREGDIPCLMGNTVLWGWLTKSADKIAVSAECSPDHGECEAIKVPKFSWLPFHHKN